MLRLIIAAGLALALTAAPALAGNGRPAHCPARWCGCWLASYFGLSDPALNKARNWARKFKRVAGPCVDCVAVWPHHVGVVKGIPKPGRVVLLSGNDGHAVRERERSSAGVIAWVRP